MKTSWVYFKNVHTGNQTNKIISRPDICCWKIPCVWTHWFLHMQVKLHWFNFLLFTTHMNILIFWGAENSYFLEPRKAATVHQIWNLGHLVSFLRGNVDLNTQLENVGHSFFSEASKQYLAIGSERLFI